MEERRGTLLFVGLILVHLVAISHQVDRGGVSVLERVIFSVLSPVQSTVGGVVRSVSSAWHSYVDLRGAHRDNAALRERLRILELTLQEKQEAAREGIRLRELAGLQEQLATPTIVAEVISRDGVPWFRTFTINRGSGDEVALNAPVLSPTGVLGRVIEIGPHAAKVQLLLDRQASAAVLLQHTMPDGRLQDVNAVTGGQVGPGEANSRDLLMQYLPSLAEVAVGDPVVTSGLDQIFPKGLMVGRVSRVQSGSGLFKEVYVTPSAQFDAVQEVLVVRRGPTAPAAEMTEGVRPAPAEKARRP
jgi:rod shape-determining protein MreC